MTARRRLVALALVAVAAAALVLSPVGIGVASELTSVFVTNWPNVQTIEGTVAVRGPVRMAEQVTFRDVIVPPVGPTETTRLVSPGTLVSGGFTNVLLSLHGEVKGSIMRRGEVGAILLPAETTIQSAFNELGLTHFDLRVAASPVSSDTPYFASSQPRSAVAFERYTVYFYNTTDKTVTVHLFAYLSN